MRTMLLSTAALFVAASAAAEPETRGQSFAEILGSAPGTSALRPGDLPAGWDAATFGAFLKERIDGARGMRDPLLPYGDSDGERERSIDDEAGGKDAGAPSGGSVGGREGDVQRRSDRRREDRRQDERRRQEP